MTKSTASSPLRLDENNWRIKEHLHHLLAANPSMPIGLVRCRVLMYQRHLIEKYHQRKLPLPTEEIEAIKSFSVSIKWWQNQLGVFQLKNQTAKHQEMKRRPCRTIKINGVPHKPNELYYDPDKLRPDTNTMGVMKVGNKIVDAPIHDYTKRSKGHEGNRPRCTPSSDVVGMLNAPLVDETCAEVTRIRFKNGRENTVFFANEKSMCPILKRVYEKYQEYGSGIAYLCKHIPTELWTVDTLGGGKYLPGGVSIRNGTKQSDAKLPFLRAECRHNVVKKLFEIYAQIIGLEALAIEKYCPDEYAENLLTYGDGEDCIFPSPVLQRVGQNLSEGLHFNLHQAALRIMGRELNKEDESLERLAWHFDQGDVETSQPLTYLPMGGKDGKGGRVAGTDLMVFEHKYGGQCFRLRTSIKDTVVFILMNSADQLHGNAKDEDDCGVPDCWSARFIAFGRNNVLNFMNRRRDGKVFGDAFWDIRLNNHKPLCTGEFKVGDIVSAKWGKTLLPATLIERGNEQHFQWHCDRKVLKCRRRNIFSKYCYASEPHECKHCNPVY